MQSYALIVDPDAAVAAVYAAAVRDEGLTYVSVRDGSRAVAVLVERGTPDVLITEVSLPGVDGFEIVERVRRAPSGAQTAIIMVSADRAQRERAAQARNALELGAVLSKASTTESIRRVLKRLRDGRDAPLPKLERAPLEEEAGPSGPKAAVPLGRIRAVRHGLRRA
jgi:CheY-like chemotaxis protein